MDAVGFYLTISTYRLKVNLSEAIFVVSPLARLGGKKLV
jgi:hypothetical protein